MPRPDRDSSIKIGGPEVYRFISISALASSRGLARAKGLMQPKAASRNATRTFQWFPFSRRAVPAGPESVANNGVTGRRAGPGVQRAAERRSGGLDAEMYSGIRPRINRDRRR